MTTVEGGYQPSLAGFVAGHGSINAGPMADLMTASFGLIGLTNFGERPVPSARLAEITRRPVGEVEALARRFTWPPGTRVENGFITVRPERELMAPRRRIQIGDRRFGASGCAPDVFLYAPLVRPSLLLEETCQATGISIRILFTPRGVESVDPVGAVLPLPDPRVLDLISEMGVECDSNAPGGLCSECPFYSSTEAAQGWLDDHPGGRVFTIREAWDLGFYKDWRERMSHLLNFT